MQGITLKNLASYEYIASQLQRTTDQILCVKDGYELRIYNDLEELPNSLYRETKIVNSDIDTCEYYWRSKDDDSLYVFYLGEVDNHLSKKEESSLVGTSIIYSDSKRGEARYVSFFKM